MAAFVDESTDCAICLNPLDDEDGVGGSCSPSAETITLSCGHRWHLACVREQLRASRPSKSRRLIFAGCRCAKCGAYCDHSKLEGITRRTDALRAKVDALIAEQLRADAPDSWRLARGDATAVARLVDEGRRSYAFYLCGGCDEPYFGGTVACADGADDRELETSEDRLCRSCRSVESCRDVCRERHDHAPLHVWKCRYCCRPSRYVCYGNVHFCGECHERNGERERSHRRAGAARGKPPPLEGIPCPGGGSCPHPKPGGRDAHSNGPTLDCEQLYHCALCESRRSSSGDAALAEATPGSRNFIANPSGEDGLNGWEHHPGRGGRWDVEGSEFPADENTTTNFVSNFLICGMTQTVPLHRYVRDPSSVRVEASANYMARTDCPSVFSMRVIFTDSQKRVMKSVTTDTLLAPPGVWDKATIVCDPVDGARDVLVVVFGKDCRFWRGSFGSKVCHISLRVLGTEEELSDILLPEDDDAGENRQDVGQVNYALLRERTLDLFLPVVMIFILWLYQSQQ